MRVEVEVTSCKVPSPNGVSQIDGVCLICTRCDHEVTVAGETARSYKRGYVQLKDECPNGESNFYVCDDEPEDG